MTKGGVVEKSTAKPATDLHDRIAEVIQHNLVWEAPNMSARLADAIIADLGLTVESGVIVGCLHD